VGVAPPTLTRGVKMASCEASRADSIISLNTLVPVDILKMAMRDQKKIK